MRRYGEPWSECDLCGFAFPESQMMRHYRTGRLVDAKCDDRPSWSDRLRTQDLPRERTRLAEQRVSDQGSVGPGFGYGVGPYGQTPYGDPQ